MGDSSAPFPDTRLTVLTKAADGDWQAFLNAYLEPCWREIAIVCRQRGIPPADIEDLCQTLQLRLLQEGRLRRQEVLEPLSEPFAGNMPARYLAYCRTQAESVRFRTYLKAAILNIVRESLRRRAKLPEQALDEQLAMIEAEFDKTVTTSLDLTWLTECLHESARRLCAEAKAERTRGRRRLFEILHRTVVDNQSPGFIAQQLGIDRTTVARLLSDGRTRFVGILQEVSGVESLAELKKMVASAPESLRTAMAAARSAP